MHLGQRERVEKDANMGTSLVGLRRGGRPVWPCSEWWGSETGKGQKDRQGLDHGELSTPR